MARKARVMGGVYRGTVMLMGQRLTKYQVARSAVDAERRARAFDDPCWWGVRFTFVGPAKLPRDCEWSKNQMILVNT